MSCVKDKYNLDEINTKVSPEIAVPFLKASIVAEDILSEVDSTMLREDENKLLEFVYSDTVYSMSLSEFMDDFPDENVSFDFKLEPLKITDFPEVTTEITLRSVTDNDPSLSLIVNTLLFSNPNGFPLDPVSSIEIDTVPLPMSNAPFKYATFSSGQLSVELSNGWAMPLNDVELVLKNSVDGSVVGTLEYEEILPGESQTDVIDMAGKSITSSLYGDFVNVSSKGTDGDTVQVSLDDVITAKVNGENLFVVSGSAEFPSDLEVVNDTIDVDFDLDNGMLLNTLALKSGELTIQVEYGIQEKAELFIELPYASNDEGIFSTSFIIEASNGVNPTIVSENYNLKDYRFDLSKGGSDTNALETRIRAEILSSPGVFVEFDTSNSVSATVSMKNIEPLYIDGYFGNQSISIKPESFDFDLGASDVLGQMSFADPVVTLGFHNTFGIPMRIDTLDLTMKNSSDLAKLIGAKIPFDIKGADLASTSESVQYKTSALTLDKTTNIADLINLWPNQVSTGIAASVNPNGTDGGSPTNFAYHNSAMDITLDLSVPIYGQISELSIKEYIAIDSSMSDVFQNVQRASLRSYVDNGFPLEAEINFYLADADTMILDSLVVLEGNQVLVNAGTVDETGNVITRGSRQADLIADEEDIALLREGASFIIIEAVMNTANSGNDVKIYSNYDMLIKIGLLAKLKVELNSDKED